MIQDTGYRIQDTGYRIQDTGYRRQDTGYRIQDTGYRRQDTGYRIQETGYMIQIPFPLLLGFFAGIIFIPKRSTQKIQSDMSVLVCDAGI